jgi:hypothetical protein
MTSDDISDTGSGTPGCTRGAGRFRGTLCPGPEDCLMTRSATPGGAYAAGCRSAEATTANRLKTARNRANSASTASPGTAWDAADETASTREPTGESCPECGLPLYWEPGRAGQQCDNQHWRIAPDTEARIISKPSREVARDEKPPILETIRFGVRRDELVNSCDSALAEINVGELETLCDRLHIGMTGWHAQIVRQYVSGFNTIKGEANRARTYPELDECEQAFRQLHNQVDYQSLLSGIRQTATDVAFRMDYLARQTESGYGYRLIPGTYTIEQYERDNPTQYRYGSGTPIGMAKQRAITSGSAANETAPAEYDDDAGDDEDYSEYSYTAGESGGVPGGVIVTVLIIAGLWWAAVTVPPWWKREDYRTCQCIDRHRRPAFARYRIDIQYTNMFIEHCGKKKCAATARQFIAENNSWGYEPREYELVDSMGNHGSSAEFTGVLRNG